MTEMLVAPEDETFPNRRRWTREECERLVQIGFLTGNYELIDGEIISKMGQNAPHRIALMLLGQWLVSVFGYLFVQTEKTVLLSGLEGITNDPEPDAAVTREPTTAYNNSNPGPSDVLFVVEVADSTLNFDLTTKALLYARVGIPEYWVLDINGRQIHRHRQPAQNGYGEIVVFGEEESITAPGRSETIRVGELFPPLAKG